MLIISNSPLCIEEFDLSDKNFKPCPCGYQVCSRDSPIIYSTPFNRGNWPFIHCSEVSLLVQLSRFANSATTTSRPTAKKVGAPTADVLMMRVPYSTRFLMQTSTLIFYTKTFGAFLALWKLVLTMRIRFKADLALKHRKATAAKKKEVEKREIEASSRKNLAGVRVVQKNLVYVIGLNPSIRDENQLLQTLRTREYFGQYGDIEKIVVSKAKPGGNPNQGIGVYVTYSTKEDAATCIAAVEIGRADV